MWCKQCRQDVPAVASERGGTIRCVRCRAEIAHGESISPASNRRDVAQFADYGLPLDESAWSSTTAEIPASATRPVLADSLDDLEDCTLSAELQRIRRRFDASSAAFGAGSVIPAPHSEHFPLHESPAVSSPSPHRRASRNPAANAPPVRPVPENSRGRRRASPLVWGLLSLGLMAFVCGGVLLGWSLAVGRSDLWSLGMPITLGGQFALLLGLLLQLENLWEGNRHTVDKLDEVDDRLDDLKQTAALLSSSHSSPAQAFYVHMAGGASPHLLLADLKGQLDLLAVQMAKSR
jgi:hypothetical protein